MRHKKAFGVACAIALVIVFGCESNNRADHKSKAETERRIAAGWVLEEPQNMEFAAPAIGRLTLEKADHVWVYGRTGRIKRARLASKRVAQIGTGRLRLGPKSEVEFRLTGTVKSVLIGAGGLEFADLSIPAGAQLSYSPTHDLLRIESASAPIRIGDMHGRESVTFWPTGELHILTLDRDTEVEGHTIPAGSIVCFRRLGALAWVQFTEAGVWQGESVAEGDEVRFSEAGEQTLIRRSG